MFPMPPSPACLVEQPEISAAVSRAVPRPASADPACRRLSAVTGRAGARAARRAPIAGGVAAVACHRSGPRSRSHPPSADLGRPLGRPSLAPWRSTRQRAVHAARSRTRRPRQVGFPGSPAGRVNVNVDPCPKAESTQIRPPCSSTILRHVASPMPVPGYSSRARRR